MPLTLRQLQSRRDNCLTNIEEFKTLADGIGGGDLGNVSFNATEFFKGLVTMSDQKIESFLSLFPHFPRIIEYARQAANEEIKRRNFEAEIEKVLLEKAIKMKRFYDGEQRKARKAKKRLQKLSVSSSPRIEAIDDSSEEMEEL